MFIRFKFLYGLHNINLNSKFSNSKNSEQFITIKPLDLSISLSRMEKGLFLGEVMTFNVEVENKNNVKIEDLFIVFENGSGSINPPTPVENLKNFPIMPGKRKSLPFQYKALKTGEVDLGKASIKKIKASGIWITLDKEYFSNPAPKVKVTPVSITGTQVFKKRTFRLGEEVPFEIQIENNSLFNINDVKIFFTETSSSLKKLLYKRKSKFASVPAGNSRRLTMFARL